MLILHVESPNRGAQGDSIYRTVQPCRALGERPGVAVVAGSLLSPPVHELLDRADLVVLCDVVDVDVLPALERRARAGRPTAYELNDDVLSPQPWSPTAYLARNLVTRSLSLQLAARASLLQLSARELARRFGALNPHHVVLPNHLWELPPGRPEARGPGVRIGWGGSLGHREDVRALLPVVARVLARHEGASFAVMGDDVFRAMAADLLPAGRWSFTPAGSLEAYHEFVATLDVGLAPLAPTDFNLCRSDVKFLEYAAHAVVPVCADLAPYRDTLRPGETGFLFHDAPALEATLDRVLTDPALRARVGAAGRAYVAAERLERDRIGDRVAAWRAIGLEPNTRGDLALDVDLSTARTWPGARAWALGDGPIERTLYAGLAARRDGDDAAAREAFARATGLAPRFATPWLYLGSVERDADRAIAALERAAALAPGSVAADLLLADRHLAAGRVEPARACLRRAEDACPALGVPTARLGELAEAAGDWEEAVACYARAEAANPFFALPAMRRAARALDRGEVDDAAAILERAVVRDDKLATTQLLLGRARLSQGRFVDARRALTVALERADDPVPACALLAKAEASLGNLDAARALVAELKRLQAAGARG